MSTRMWMRAFIHEYRYIEMPLENIRSPGAGDQAVVPPEAT